MSQKILYYKWKEDCKQYCDAANAIIKCGKFNNFMVDSNTYNAFKKAGVLDIWFEPVYEQQFKVGDWVIRIGDNYIFKIKEVIGLGVFDNDNILFYNRNIRLATEKEIEQHLISEAEKRGYTFGNHDCLYSPVHTTTHGEILEYRYYQRFDRFFLKGNWGANCIYNNGKWAEIIPNKSIIKMRSTSGDFELEVSREGIYYAKDKKWLDIYQISLLSKLDKEMCNVIYNSSNSDFIGSQIYQCCDLKITVGCKADIPIEDWKNVYDEYLKFQK